MVSLFAQYKCYIITKYGLIQQQIQRLHSVPGKQDIKEDGSDIGAPDKKSISQQSHHMHSRSYHRQSKEWTGNAG